MHLQLWLECEIMIDLEVLFSKYVCSSSLLFCGLICLLWLCIFQRTCIILFILNWMFVTFQCFVSDHWDPFQRSSPRIGVSAVPTMCWGLPRNLVHDSLIYWYSWIFYRAFVVDQAANDCDLEPVAYEFFTQAYILYEEEISVS